MSIISSIMGSLIGVILGAWINNVFTWKIKGSIEALDLISKDLLAIITYFSSTYEPPHKNDRDDYRLHLAQITLLNAAVLDSAFESHVAALRAMAEDIVNHDRNITPVYSKKEIQAKQTCCNEFFNVIISKRKEISSLCYMLKQLNPFEIVCKK